MAVSKVCLSLHNLMVEVESEFQYPDHMTDLSNRAMTLFVSALEICTEKGLDLKTDDINEYIEEEDA